MRTAISSCTESAVVSNRRSAPGGSPFGAADRASRTRLTSSGGSPSTPPVAHTRSIAAIPSVATGTGCTAVTEPSGASSDTAIDAAPAGPRTVRPKPASAGSRSRAESRAPNVGRDPVVVR